MLVVTRNLPNFFLGAFLFLSFIFAPNLWADDGGQIININQSYQIAFTDLGNRVLNRGDIVKVSLNADEFLYLQVLESSAILSKLGPSKIEGFQTNLSDFQRMAVGNAVVKINQAPAKIDNSTDNVAVANNGQDASQQRIEKLEDDLAQAQVKIKFLEDSNQKSKEILNGLMAQSQVPKPGLEAQDENKKSKEMLDQLKVRFDNMNKILNESN